MCGCWFPIDKIEPINGKHIGPGMKSLYRFVVKYTELINANANKTIRRIVCILAMYWLGLHVEVLVFECSSW